MFCAELRRTLDGMGISYEVILVDDGSSDGSYSAAAELTWPELLLVRLVRNAGHQAALDVGLRHASGEFVVTMDSDLQHPPTVIPQLLAKARDLGVDVVYAVRSSRHEETFFKRESAHWYYRTMRLMSGVPVIDNAADFRLMSRFVVDVLNGIPERKVFRLLLPALGFSSSTVDYVAEPRRAGESKYSVRRMASLAVLSSVQFSRHPLRVVAGFGLVMALAAFVWLCYVVVSFISGNALVGWPSIMSVVLLLGGMTLFSLGVIGEYVGEIYEMVKRRPQYVVRDVHGPSTSDSESQG